MFVFLNRFFPRLTTKFAISAESRALDTDFLSGEKANKTHAKKLSTKRERETEFLTYKTVCTCFRPINFLR